MTGWMASLPFVKIHRAILLERRHTILAPRHDVGQAVDDHSRIGSEILEGNVRGIPRG